MSIEAMKQPAQATQAEVTDEQIKMLIPCGDAWKYEVGFPEAIQFARAILALRPVQVPMTGAQCTAAWFGSPVDASWAAEDAYNQGITAQAKKETP